MQTIRQFIGNIHAGAVGASGMITLLFTSMSMLNSAEKAINRIWKTDNQRSLFHRISTYWLFISLGPLAYAFAIGSSVSDDLQWVQIIPKGWGGFVIQMLFFFSIYKWVPNRKVNWTPPLIASILTTFLWNLATSGFALYASKVVTYNKIYGSLGAIPILLIWIYIIWVIVLTGAAFAAALQNRIDLK